MCPLGGSWHPSWTTKEFNPGERGASGQRVGLLDEWEGRRVWEGVVVPASAALTSLVDQSGGQNYLGNQARVEYESFLAANKTPAPSCAQNTATARVEAVSQPMAPRYWLASVISWPMGLRSKSTLLLPHGSRGLTVPTRATRGSLVHTHAR